MPTYKFPYKNETISYTAEFNGNKTGVRVQLEGIHFTVAPLGNCCGATLLHSIGSGTPRYLYGESLETAEKLLHSFLTKTSHWNKHKGWNTSTPYKLLAYRLQRSKLLFVDKMKVFGDTAYGRRTHASWYYMARNNKGWIVPENSRVVNPVHGNTLVTGEYHTNKREVINMV